MNNLNNLQVIIPSGGCGRRMKSFGPKALIQLPSKESLIKRQLDILHTIYSAANIIVVLGFESAKVIDEIKKLPYKVSYAVNSDYANTNVVHSLRLGLNKIYDKTSPVLIVYGDLIFNEDMFINFKPECSTAIIDSHQQFGITEVGVTTVENEISQFAYGLSVKWTQTVYLANIELQLFRSFVNEPRNCRLFGFEALNYVLNHGGKLRYNEPHNMQVLEIDSSKDIELIGRIIK